MVDPLSVNPCENGQRTQLWRFTLAALPDMVLPTMFVRPKVDPTTPPVAMVVLLEMMVFVMMTSPLSVYATPPESLKNSLKFTNVTQRFRELMNWRNDRLQLRLWL